MRPVRLEKTESRTFDQPQQNGLMGNAGTMMTLNGKSQMEITLAEAIQQVKHQADSPGPKLITISRDSSSSEQNPSRKLPPGVLAADWDKVPESFRVAFKQALVDETFPIYICGEAGRGKTFAMASAYMRCPGIPQWLDFQPWIKRLMSVRSGGDGDGDAFWLEKIKSAYAVFIDDCGIRADSEAQQSLFLEVLNIRHGKLTVITGNHEPDKLHKVFDSRIASRLLEGVVFRLKGTDRRMAGTKVIDE